MPIFDTPSLELVCTGLGYPEGPIAQPDASVLLVEIKNQRLTRVHADGRIEPLLNIPGGPNGAAFGPDGKLYVCNDGGFYWGPPFEIPLPNGQTLWIAALEAPDYKGGSVQRVDLTTRQVETLYTECSTSWDMGGFGPREPKKQRLPAPIKLKGPDDLVFDSAGGFWVADYGKTRPTDKDITGIYYAKADGSSIEQKIGGLVSPNGIGLSPKGDRLYASLTFARMIVYWELSEPGCIVPNPQTLDGMHLLTADLPGQAILDSLSLDEEGNVYVMTMMPNGNNPVINGGVTVVSPEGEVLETLTIDLKDKDGKPLFAPMPSHVCFGGPDRKTAYITCGASGMLAKVNTTIPGLKSAC